MDDAEVAAVIAALQAQVAQLEIELRTRINHAGQSLQHLIQAAEFLAKGEDSTAESFLGAASSFAQQVL